MAGYPWSIYLFLLLAFCTLLAVATLLCCAMIFLLSSVKRHACGKRWKLQFSTGPRPGGLPDSDNSSHGDFIIFDPGPSSDRNLLPARKDSGVNTGEPAPAASPLSAKLFHLPSSLFLSSVCIPKLGICGVLSWATQPTRCWAHTRHGGHVSRRLDLRPTRHQNFN